VNWLRQKVKNAMTWASGEETPFPELGKFLLIGGDAHLQIRETFFGDNVYVDEDCGVYTRQFLGFEDAFYIQVYVHESVHLSDALELITRGRECGKAS